jgi:hypothetical protein
VSRRRYKAPTAALLSLLVFQGLLVPGPRAQPEPPLILTLAHAGAASTSVTHCQAASRELRFGWIEVGDEPEMPGSLYGRGTPVCLAVYRVDEDR